MYGTPLVVWISTLIGGFPRAYYRTTDGAAVASGQRRVNYTARNSNFGVANRPSDVRRNGVGEIPDAEGNAVA